VAAERWLLAAGGTGEGPDEWVVLVNPGAEAVTASIGGLVGDEVLPIEGLQDLELGPAGRFAIQLGTRIERSPLSLLVEATGPVVVERDLFGDADGDGGVSAVVGIPLR
jgi:hypothetical protein